MIEQLSSSQFFFIVLSWAITQVELSLLTGNTKYITQQEFDVFFLACHPMPMPQTCNINVINWMDDSIYQQPSMHNAISPCAKSSIIQLPSSFLYIPTNSSQNRIPISNPLPFLKAREKETFHGKEMIESRKERESYIIWTYP